MKQDNNQTLDPDPAEVLLARLEQIQTKTAEETSKLEAERVRIWEERRPITQLQEKCNCLAQKIERAKKRRTAIVVNVAEFNHAMDACFESDSLEDGGRIVVDVARQMENRPDLANAGFTLIQLDKWLVRKEAELKTLNTELDNLTKKSPDGLKWLKPWRYAVREAAAEGQANG